MADENTLLISESFKGADTADLGDNLLYYNYSVKHLLSLHKSGVPNDSNAFMCAFRSFEGEVFENFVYEKLLRYAIDHPRIEKFVVKGPHKPKRTHALPNTLSVNAKGQIVYRTRNNEIGEYDGLIFTDKELYFVEMTVVGSVANLRKRLRKKKALLEILFPQYDVKALLVLREGVVGLRQLPAYATAWTIQPVSGEAVFSYKAAHPKPARKPFEPVVHPKIVEAETLQPHPFKYYNTLAWVLKSIRGKKDRLLNMGFLRSETFVRYHDLFTKVYIGYLSVDDFEAVTGTRMAEEGDRPVYVALEKEHTGRIVLTYFYPHSRKKLDNILVSDSGDVTVAKKDPFGITVTEIAHMSKIMTPAHRLVPRDIATVGKLLGGLNEQAGVAGS